MMRVLELDCSTIDRQHQNFWLEGNTTAPRGLNGRSQVLFAENRRWVGQLDLLPVRMRQKLQADVIGDQLRGRAGVIRMILSNPGIPSSSDDDEASFQRFSGVSQSQRFEGKQAFGDGASFEDGAGFALPQMGRPTAIEPAAMGAIFLRVDGYAGRNLPVGAKFSHDDFLYRVQSNLDGVIRFNPPLRVAIPMGANLEVAKPAILVRLQADDGWRPFAEYGRNGRAMSVKVEEVFER